MAKASFIGVKRRRGTKHFESRAVMGGAIHHVGTFETKKDAALARDLFLITNAEDIKKYKLNNPHLLDAKTKPAMPQAIASVLKDVGDRAPRSRTGFRYISKEHYGYIFRRTEGTGKDRTVTRARFDSLEEALAERFKQTGIPVTERS